MASLPGGLGPGLPSALRFFRAALAWPGSEVSLLIASRGSNEDIIGTSTSIEGANYRNGFGPVPGGAPFSFKKLHSVFPQNRYFQEAGAASGTGLVQQMVQIVASHDLTLFVSGTAAGQGRLMARGAKGEESMWNTPTDLA